MADGSIKIAIEVDGKQINIAADSLKDLESAGRKSGDGTKEAEDGLKGVSNESTKAGSNIKKFAAALGLVAISAAAFRVLRQSLDAAISRFDTLNTFPKVLQELGVSAESSERAMTNLSDGIDGLPTKLDEIAGNAQRMYTSFDDMDKATDSAIALNNALLGSGSSAADAQRGTQQYIKYLQTGKMEMDTWTTLQETMDVGLIKIAESFGYTGRTAKTQLYSALQDGVITMDQFNDKLIEVGTGTGIMAKLAKENSLGLATSIGNLRNAFARGVTVIIERFNNLSKAVTGNEIAENIDGLKSVVSSSFNMIGNVIDATTPIIVFFANGVKMTIPIVEALTPAIFGLMTAYGAYVVISKTAGAINAANAVLAVAQTSTKTLTIATNAQVAATIAKTGATKADALATVAQTGAVKLSTIAIGLFTGQLKLSTVAMIAKAGAARILGTALRFLSGPVGIAVTLIGALATAAAVTVKWFKRTSQEAERMKAETEELGNATEQLNNNVADSAKSYEEHQKGLESAAVANENLAKRVEELASKENKSASEKQLLASYTDQLNESVVGLNLSYDEQADSLNMSSEQLQARINLMKEEESLAASQERLLEIDKERNDVNMQLEEINKLREESIKLHEDGELTNRQYSQSVLELDEQEQELIATKESLKEQQKVTEAQITESMAIITEATESGIASQKLAYEDLSESQQQTVDNMKSTWEDYKDAATDMFDTISTKSDMSVAEMTQNLEKNQEIIGKWAENIATLAERGVDEGLLNTLREAGPESAGHVNALVKASDSELEKLSDAFAKGGETATDALSKSLGIENSNLLDAVSGLVVDTEKSLRDQIKAADWEGLGINLPEGLSGGIDKGAPQVEKSAIEMAEKTTAATREAFQTRSPSKIYEAIGRDLDLGLVVGVQKGTGIVLQAVQQLFNRIHMTSMQKFSFIRSNYKNQTDALKNMMVSQFNSIGRNSMAGLNSGLNAGSGHVMATARRIANNVNATMKRALDIHSPSRKAEREVGKQYTAGVARGIEKNARLAYDAVNKLSSGILRVSTPEAALGVNQMAYSGGGSARTTGPSNSVSPTIAGSNQPQVINIHPSDVIIDSRVAGKVLWKPIKDNIDINTGTITHFGGG